MVTGEGFPQVIDDEVEEEITDSKTYYDLVKGTIGWGRAFGEGTFNGRPNEAIPLEQNFENVHGVFLLKDSLDSE